jgi:predicted Rossmann-fold nucleotide-binding protein
MTNRIFELAKQADLIQWDALPSGAITPDHASVAKARKFAELIVQECFEVINAGKVGFNQVPAEVALDLTAKNVKAYFGVEE